MIAVDQLIQMRKDLPAPDKVEIGKELLLPYLQGRIFVEPGERVEGIILAVREVSIPPKGVLRAWCYGDLIVKLQDVKPEPLPGPGKNTQLECESCGEICTFTEKSWKLYQSGKTYRCGECMEDFPKPEKEQV